MHLDLPLIWVCIICFGAVMYVLLDGFGLGVGIVSAFQKDRHARDLMITSMTPVWDGNETWLILVGAFLYAAFPDAYSILLPRLYIPIMIMLMALIFRAVSIEMRHQAKGMAGLFWDVMFFLGSLLAAIAQGLILGSLVQGDYVPAHQAYVWWTPFSMLTAIGVVFGYSLLGSTWLVMKAHGSLQEWSRRASGFALLGMLAVSATVSYWTPHIHEQAMAWWMHGAGFFAATVLLLVKAACVILLLIGLGKRICWLPFVSTIGLFAVGAIALAVSFWPVMIPPSTGFRALASDPGALLFLLKGVVFLLPLLVIYSGYVYYTFYGKVDIQDSY